MTHWLGPDRTTSNSCAPQVNGVTGSVVGRVEVVVSVERHVLIRTSSGLLGGSTRVGFNEIKYPVGSLTFDLLTVNKIRRFTTLSDNVSFSMDHLESVQ